VKDLSDLFLYALYFVLKKEVIERQITAAVWDDIINANSAKKGGK
jgi:hypothetical protein